MIRFPALLLLACLPACDTGGLGYAGLPAERVEAGGAVFDIRRRGARAEVLRLSNHAFPRFPWVAWRGAVAVARATGCRPEWIVGDPSVLHVGLACGGDPAPAIPRAAPRLICDMAGLSAGPTGLGEAELRCRLQ
ncbi:hypothetical protein E0K89_012230 [Aquicoccus sp. SCR17]|nr:hypothetical protein [Carideicomes alvinocaridis]